MSFTVTNKSVHGQMSGTTAQEVQVLTGASEATIVKTLELINPGASSCSVDVIRKDAGGNAYATIPVGMKANDYLVLWEGFYVMPSGHTLWIKADSAQCVAVASVIERN